VTKNLSLCWIHEGRHYARLTPVVPSHAEQLSRFQERFWDYYAALQRYYLRDRLLQSHEIPRLAILLRTAAAGG
jgi:hypothetical protein